MKLLLMFLSVLGVTFSFGQTFTEVIKAAAFDRSEEDRLGYDVDISENYAIIGAYGDDFGDLNPNMGSAYIFEKTGIEDWKFVQKISNSDQDDYDRFGWSVAIEGDYAVVGAYGEDHNIEDAESLAKAGSAYIFECNDEGVWEEVQKIVASDRGEDDEFGWTVAVSGTTIIVGAHQEDEDELGGDFIFWSGSVYAFDRNDEGIWEESQKIVAWDRQADSGGGDETMSIWHYQDIDYGDRFGCSIAISGDYMIVGAHNGDYNVEGLGGISQAGAAYIFNRVGEVWEADQKVVATIRGGWDRYGYSVAIDSNVAVVGAKAEDHSEFEAAWLHNAGSAFIYTRDEVGFWGVQKIDASDRDVGDHFGFDVAIADDYMVIGSDAQNFDADVADELSNAGAAYIFEKDDLGDWSEIQKIDASDRDSLDVFASCVSISSHTIFVGAWQQDLDSASADYVEDAGAGYFFSSLLCTEAFFEQSIDLCAGESLTIGESNYTISGIYVDTLLNSDACDSIITTNLTVAEIVESEQTFDICSGEFVIVGESVYTEAGTYTDLLESEAGCDSTVTTTVILITEIDNTIEIEAGVNLTSNEPVSISTSFQWIKCTPFETIDGATEQTYTVIENGDYAVIIEKDLCIDTSICATVTHIGINANNLNYLTVFPNPNNGTFTLKLDDFKGKMFEIRILNGLGSEVYRSSLTALKTEIDLVNLAKGLYFVEISDGAHILIKKIEIQ